MGVAAGGRRPVTVATGDAAIATGAATMEHTAACAELARKAEATVTGECGAATAAIA